MINSGIMIFNESFTKIEYLNEVAKDFLLQATTDDLSLGDFPSIPRTNDGLIPCNA